jgi:hypothetical protein
MKNTFLIILLFLSFKIMAETQSPYTVFIKPGARLTNTLDKTEVILEKGIYAKVLEINPKRRDIFNVYDKSGLIKYRVSALDLVEIAEDIKLLPQINAEKIYRPKSALKAEQAFARFDSQFSVHVDSLQISDLDNIYFNQASSVFATRYEARTLYVSELPVEFGFNFNSQSVYWKNEAESVKISILSLGPQFKYKFYQDNDFNLHALLGAEIALLYKGSTDLYNDKYSATLFDIGIESEWQSSLGLFSFGSHFRKHSIALTESNRTNLELVPKEFSLSSLGLMVGYKMEWDL